MSDTELSGWHDGVLYSNGRPWHDWPENSTGAHSVTGPTGEGYEWGLMDSLRLGWFRVRFWARRWGKRLALALVGLVFLVLAVAIFAPIFIATLHLARWVCS